MRRGAHDGAAGPGRTTTTTPNDPPAEAGRLRAFLDTMVSTTRAVVAASDRAALLSGACSALVAHGSFVMAWIGADEDGDGWLERLAVAGDASGYTDGLRVSTLDIPEGRGPTGTAVRTGEP